MQYFVHSQQEFVYKYVVMLSDTDQFKHMSFANYLKLMFLATDALFVSCMDDSFLSSFRLKLVNSRMQFKRQTITGDNVLIKVNTSKPNGKVFPLLYTFIIEATGELVGLGRQTYALVDQISNTQQELTSGMENLLNPICVDESNLLYKY